MNDIQRFKSMFKNCALEEESNRINAYDEYGNVIACLFYAKEEIESFYEGNQVETNEDDPANRTHITVSAYDYIITEFGNYESAFQSI